MWAMARLPGRMQRGLGRLLGRLSVGLAARRREIARTNLALCFPDRTTEERERILRAHFESLGIGLFETAMAWWASDRHLRGLVRYDGLEHLQTAMASGRGILLLTGHFTCLELGARFMTWHLPFHAMYRPHKNALYEAVMRRCRERQSQRPVLPRDDVRGTVRALRRGGAVWYAPDQNYGGTDTVFVPFFGVPASTITATARLATMGHALVLPYWPRRRDDGSGYEIVIEPPLDNFPGPDPTEDARRINALVERRVRCCPEQYLWVHRRFKTRPPGEASPYPR